MELFPYKKQISQNNRNNLGANYKASDSKIVRFYSARDKDGAHSPSHVFPVSDNFEKLSSLDCVW